MIYSFKNHIPVIHESSFVHPLAAVTGNVIIGKDCYIGPGCAIRGDWGEIILEDGNLIQEDITPDSSTTQFTLISLNSNTSGPPILLKEITFFILYNL